MIATIIPGLAATATAGSSQLPAKRSTSLFAKVTAAETTPTQHDPCPWVRPAVQAGETDLQLADLVVSRMTLAEKADFVVLHNGGGYENINSGVPALCIPPLTMQDGPNGISAGMTGVSALPASLGIAASFDLGLAYDYGQVLGQEARGKGIDAVQGPNLNLLRVPESGRAYEGYGEDPMLVSVMGVADIDGIQSQGVMADAKHFTAYNQETARTVLNQEIGSRALEELYLAPFMAAVKRAHVASIMCAYGAINGVNDCSDPRLYAALRNWDFTGFVRSDLEAVRSPRAAFLAGLDLIKPDTPDSIIELVDTHRLPASLLTQAVRKVLMEMFRFHLIGIPARGGAESNVTSKSHASFALLAAEHSIVLLKNSGATLPISASHSGSVAVIGTDSTSAAVSEGEGGAHVLGPFLVKPLVAIEHAIGQRNVAYAPGAPVTPHLPAIPRTYFRKGSPLPSIAPPTHPIRSGKSDLGIIHSKGVTGEIATAGRPQASGSRWSVWKATIVPPKTGLYEISLGESGDSWLSINGHDIMAFRGLHGRVTWTTTVSLKKGSPYDFELDWFRTDRSNPRLGWEYVTPLIDQAVDAAQHAHTAIVFVSDFSSEGFDRPNLELPGDADALIKAVAAVNPRTIVVLNTGGAVLMPWLDSVQSVIEAWYPGEEDGTATASVLFGGVDPSARLPITFPSSDDAVATATANRWPGVDSTVQYSEGLDIGYRYVLAHHLQPLYAFGYGLSYTTFHLATPTVADTSQRDTISVQVTNTGKRSGTDVVECYLQYPSSADEPPLQLRGFVDANLRPGQSKIVHITLSRSAFESFENGRFQVPSGPFAAFVGSSSESVGPQIAVQPPTKA